MSAVMTKVQKEFPFTHNLGATTNRDNEGEESSPSIARKAP